ncbi:28S ribosomal protein S23, mitochondrial isoform X1 [Crotalus tigris]|uniref:28S ribosomal protein S23, mitochondrial isoform X1 n=1 Tax=Crotalus tigris TaxID=88082 RepID=UPI00192F7C13|nr:28S ribosomal protein S23, mitochondrial isoform X1 [Crotalus tigris]
MAESRLEKLGTIFTRVQNLLRSGAIRESQKPIWYDVYAAFPPLREPTYRNIRPLVGKIKDTVPPILYPEDQIRAKFYEVYGAGSGIFELARSNYKSPCQRFVEKYNELKNKEGEMDEDLLFAETGKALLAEGLVLSRKGKKFFYSLDDILHFCLFSNEVAPRPPSTMPVLELQGLLQDKEDGTENPEPKTEPSEKPMEEPFPS